MSLDAETCSSLPHLMSSIPEISSKLDLFTAFAGSFLPVFFFASLSMGYTQCQKEELYGRKQPDEYDRA